MFQFDLLDEKNYDLISILYTLIAIMNSIPTSAPALITTPTSASTQALTSN